MRLRRYRRGLLGAGGVFIALVLLTLGVVAQPPSSLFYHQLPQAALDYSRIEIKFVEGSAVRLRNGGLTSLSGVNMSSISSALADPRVQGIDRLFDRSEAALEAERLSLASTVDVPDLNLWYVLALAPATPVADARNYVDFLNTLPGVQTAYPAPRPAPLPQRIDGVDATPDFSTQQGYGAAAPNGIGLYGLDLPGIDGTHVTVVDIEYDWNFDHEDLAISPVHLLAGDLYHFFGSDHGTAVLGQIAGGVNGFGVNGLTPSVTTRVASPIFNNNYNIARAINLSANQLQAGDVMLLEQQTFGPTNAFCNCGAPENCEYYVPVEYIQSAFDAIKNATAKGIIVIEAGGNGGLNLNDPVFGNLFNRSFRDSGAILVGAAQSWNRVPHCWSTAGPRVDLFAWGDSIVTTGYGDLYSADGVNAYYTAFFGGTSGASPVITSAAIALQGVAKQRGMVLTPAQMRQFLAVGGTPQGASPRKIGVMPNMASAILALPLKAPELVSPVEGDTVVGELPALVWKPSPTADQVTQYRVSLFDPSGVLIRRFDVPAASCEETCTLAVSGVKLARGQYRWRVQARSAIRNRNSVFETFRLEVPATPELVSPIHQQVAPAPTLVWKRIALSTQFRVRVLNADSNALIFRSVWLRADDLGCPQPGDTCTYELPETLRNGTYRWRVQGRNNALFIGQSRPASAILTVQFPNQPELISPVETVVDSATVELLWAQVTNAAEYRVQVRNANNRNMIFNSGWLNAGGLCLDEVCGVFTPELRNRPYEWRVQARDLGVAPNVRNSAWVPFAVRVLLLEAQAAP